MRLTAFSHGAGCGCKLASAELRGALAAMTVPLPTHPDVLVGPATADDAGIVRLDDGRALVHTADFFTPVVDDAGDWGRIAAANALSDVYAMGGRPTSALNLVGWPRDRLPWSLLGRVLDGAATVLAEAGCPVVGGHSIDDPEPKFGLAVTGLVEPDRLLTNAGGRPGDTLVLTKDLGTGIITTAHKRGLPGGEGLGAAIDSMARLNAGAAAVAGAHGLRAATDITGFGLIGHLTELVRASGVAAEVWAGRLPALPGAWDGLAAGAVSGGTARNREDTAHVDWGTVDEAVRLLACDAQTSGGLLLAVPADRLDAVRADLEARGQRAAVVGRLVERDPDPDAGGSLIRVTAGAGPARPAGES